ncbi:MAG: Fe-S cluster assembly protein SufD, partial [Bacteroidia bacterium]|nr:Fe-S cluster assembly protein SufD [Bacteroidia bacterium]
EVSKYIYKTVPHDTNAFTALNSAFSTNPVVISLEKNTVLDKPVNIVYVDSGKGYIFTQPHVFFYAAESSQGTIIESSYLMNASSFSNRVTEIIINDNAHIKWIKVQQEDHDHGLISTTASDIGKDATFDITTVCIDGELIRNDLIIRMQKQNSVSHLHGVYVLNDSQQVDNHTLVDHQVANCESNELYRGVVDETAMAVFNGKVFVQPDAQKTNAFQSNANILLSDDATVNTKPQLEIWADDVKCSHGATTGQLDEEAMFYLRSRGIGSDKAKELLLNAFTKDVIDNIEIPKLKEFILRNIKNKLHKED